jgi:tetratricopeptide (TPR) repeat protein
LLYPAAVAWGEILRIELLGDLAVNDKSSPVFHGTFLIPEGEEREIFTGPYTVGLVWEEVDSGRYDFTARLYGLGPEFHISEYNISLRTSENMLLPSVPVKEETIVNYRITLLDDTTKAVNTEYSLSDSSLWGVSQSTHYNTHWVRGSLIDFTWNKEFRYLEFIYNKYRESYKLSEFEKIETYIHPQPTDEVYLDSAYYYSIQPRKRRIDLVYGHDIKAATPVPACEFLVYRLWGYGPRWMVIGLAKYYDDNMLIIRDYIADFDKDRLLDILKDENRVRNDTGMVITGALAFWLLQNESFIEFKNLYTKSTTLNFENRFEDIYGYDFDELLERFLKHAQNYNPAQGELDYYALLYFNQKNLKKAKGYYEELAILGEGDRIANLKKLGACQFWLGNFSAADTIYDMLLSLGDDSPETYFMKGDLSLARGEPDMAFGFFNTSLEKEFATGGLRKTDSAFVLLKKIEEQAGRLLEYNLETANMKIVKGEDADSLLNNVIKRAINMSNKSSDDPRPYAISGRAYSLSGDYESSILQFNTAYFLETNPYFQSFILLEMGKTEDTLGDREQAKQYYRRILDSGGGEYHKTLAEKYLSSAFRRK